VILFSVHIATCYAHFILVLTIFILRLRVRYLLALDK
jgi:hypothetical protein